MRQRTTAPVSEIHPKHSRIVVGAFHGRNMIPAQQTRREDRKADDRARGDNSGGNVQGLNLASAFSSKRRIASGRDGFG